MRQIVKEALLTINCHPVEQTNFEPDARTVADMLRGKIGDCQALIHICGLRYGAEPDVASLPPGTPRRSYTQWEYHIGRQLQEERGDDHFRVYIFICPEDFPYDEEPDSESQEKRDLQLAHRSHLFDDPHLREKPKDGDDLKLRILALQEQVFALQHEQAEVKTEVLKNRYLGLKAFAVLLLLLGGIYGGIHFLYRGQKELIDGQKLDTPALRARLTESSERTLQQELAIAGQIPDSEDRDKGREAAEIAHAARIARIDDLASRLSELFATGRASPILVEMLRIVDAEGVDAALAYEERQRPALLESIKAARLMDRERTRVSLQPILKAAQIQATKGDSTAARASYQEILALEPDWPEAMKAFAKFLYDMEPHSIVDRNGKSSLDTSDVKTMYALANRLQILSPDDEVALRFLSDCSERIGAVFLFSRNIEDAKNAPAHFQRCLDIDKKLFTANPKSTEYAFDFAVSLNGYFDCFVCLLQYDLPGDIEQAFAYFQTDFELSDKLIVANPASAHPLRNLYKSLGERGTVLARRGLRGDAEKALTYYQSCLKLSEKFLTASPDSAQAARDVSISLENLGDFLTQRGQPGDADAALAHFERSLETSKKLLTANPDSVEAARDVWVSCWKLANLAESTGKGDAASWWKRTYDILLGMEEKGMFLSPEDKRLLETLRGKVGGN